MQNNKNNKNNKQSFRSEISLWRKLSEYNYCYYKNNNCRNVNYRICVNNCINNIRATFTCHKHQIETKVKTC